MAVAGEYDRFDFSAVGDVTEVRLTAVDSWIYLAEVKVLGGTAAAAPPEIANGSYGGGVINEAYFGTTYDGQTSASGSYQVFGLKDVGAWASYELESASTVSSVEIAMSFAKIKQLDVEVKVGGVWQYVGRHTFDVAVAGEYDRFDFSAISDVTEVRLTAVDSWIYLAEVKIA